VTLFHRDLGGVGNPPLVILHGLLGSSRNWQTAGRDLAARYHVRALDLRNHGSSPQAAEMDYEVLVNDVSEYLDTHALTRVTLLGHSLGGKVAMRLACRQPERVEQLVVVDIAPRAYSSAAHRAEFEAMAAIDLAGLASRAAAEQLLEAKVPDWAMRKFLVTNLEHTAEGRWRWLVNLPVLMASLPVLEADSLAPTDRFAGPSLFVVGGRSGYVREEDGPAMLRHFPQARIDTLPQAGHNPHIDSRADFVARLFSALP